jgi:hypothetical protein
LLTVDANSANGFTIPSGNDVSISEFSVVNGYSGASVAGTLTLTSSTLSGNVFGVSTSGLTTISSSTISGSSYDGISATGGTLTIQSSTISGNYYYGISTANAVLNIQSSTISSTSYGAGVSAYGGNITIQSSTLANNPGGLDAFGGATISLTNTILANGNNCGGTVSNINSGGHNIASDNSCASRLTQTGDQNNTDPQIGTLADNGGPTLTHALAGTSLAIDVGSCPSETEDQRGEPRPVDDPAVTDGAAGFCDIGAVERAPVSVSGKIVFISSTASNGDLGGLAGADATCNSLAATAGLSGTFKAWLSDAVDSPSTRFAQAAEPYKLVDGTTVANDWADLLDGTLAVPINRDELGGVQVVLDRVWTGTFADGTINGVAKCSTASGEWTQPSGGFHGGSVGGYGLNTQSNSTWSAAGTDSCADVTHIYCFEQ